MFLYIFGNNFFDDASFHAQRERERERERVLAGQVRMIS